MERTATALWRGDLKTGSGSISSQSGVLKQTPYGFKTRFEEAPGTNPEELIAAAHAGCFTMALSAKLDAAGIKAESIQTTAAVTLEKIDGAYSITALHLDLMANVPGAEQAAFAALATAAKDECPVSKLFKVQATLSAQLGPTPT